MLKNSNKLFIAWMIAFIFASILLSFSQFKSSSNDSKYYTDLVVRHHSLSIDKILTPKWGENYWGFDPNSYNLDLFPGHLLMGVAVTKLGAPPTQALHILGMFFQIASIFLLVKIAEEFIEKNMASVIYYGILITPMAFSYNIRANHELGIMFFSLLSLFSGLKLSKKYWWGGVSCLCSLMLLWIKGPFFIFSILLTMVGFITSEFNNKKYSTLFLTTLASVVLILSSAYFFNNYYLQTTGINFLEGFWKIQIEGRQLPYTHAFSFITLKLYNLYYYSWHILVYSLPWFFILIFSWFKNKELIFFKSKLSLCYLSSVLAFVLVFTVNSRHAARYVFPAYYLFSAWVILILIQRSKKFQLIHLKISERGLHVVAPILWLLIFSLHFIF